MRRYPHLRISPRGLGPSGTSTHLTRQLSGTHYDKVRTISRSTRTGAAPTSKRQRWTGESETLHGNGERDARHRSALTKLFCFLWHRPQQNPRTYARIDNRHSTGLAMSDLDNSRKIELECLRLAAECAQLASDLESSALQSHFFRMGRIWTAQADMGEDHRQHGSAEVA